MIGMLPALLMPPALSANSVLRLWSVTIAAASSLLGAVEREGWSFSLPLPPQSVRLHGYLCHCQGWPVDPLLCAGCHPLICTSCAPQQLALNAVCAGGCLQRPAAWKRPARWAVGELLVRCLREEAEHVCAQVSAAFWVCFVSTGAAMLADVRCCCSL